MATPATLFRNNRDLSRERLVPRDYVDLVTAISRGKRLVINARVADLSRFGAHIRTQESFARHDRIRVLLPLVGDIDAQVMWALSGCFGCRFTDPIDRRLYPQILAMIKMAHANDPNLVVPLLAERITLRGNSKG